MADLDPIAIYGALLSSVLAINEFIKRRPKVKVISESTISIGEKETPSKLQVKIINNGTRSVEIESVQLIIREGKIIGSGHLTIPKSFDSISRGGDVDEDYYPIHLEDGQSFTVNFNRDEIKNFLDVGETLQSIIAKDVSGKEYKGKPPELGLRFRI